MKFKITLLLLLTLWLGNAQVTNEGKPHSWKLSNLPKVTAAVMPAYNMQALQEEDKNNKDLKKPWRFAHEFAVNYTLQNSGNWQTLANGDRIWRMRFKSAGAITMHFWFKDFFIPKGSLLYVYNNEHTDLFGAYDSRQNTSPYMGTWPVSGDDVWVEYFEPAAQAGQGKLEMFKLGHGYRAIHQNISGQETLSADCHYDVECFVEQIDNLKDISKKSVTAMLGSTDDGAFLCSGGLVNNTANDGKPYILSANHAWSEGAMYTFRFNWINPEPACPSSIDGDSSINDNQTISGAILRARREESDFMLLEITSALPADWDLVWSGWDRSGTVPPYSYAVHHPAGDIMKVSLELDPLQMLDNVDNNGAVNVWEINNWEVGGLEGGSSGSPLLDNYGRIIGQAWYIYGADVCSGSEPGGQSSGYGRFDVSWDAGATTASRLKEWLDPQNTGAETVDFYPPQTIYTVDAKAALFELGHDDCDTTISPVIRLINYGSQNLTSAQINYAVNGGTPTVLNWSGSLAENYGTLINLPQLNGNTGDNVFTVTVTNPNGVTDGNLANNNITNYFTTPAIYGISDVTFNILTDGYGEEISWELRNEAGNILYSVAQNTYEDNTDYSQIFNISQGGCYTFRIIDGYGDGICCTQGQGHYSLTTASGQVIIEGGDYEHGESVAFKLQGPMGTVANELAARVKVYPNPSAGIFNISNTSGRDLQYTLYTILGQQVTAGSLKYGNGSINAGNAAGGVYLLKLNDAVGNTTTFKLLKQ